MGHSRAGTVAQTRLHVRRKKELTAGPHLSVEGRGGGGRGLPLLCWARGQPTREREKGRRWAMLWAKRRGKGEGAQ